MAFIDPLYCGAAWRRKAWYVIAMVLAVAVPAAALLHQGCWCWAIRSSAGYGLPHSDGFEAQLQQALAARGHPISIVDGAVSGDTSAGGRAQTGLDTGRRGGCGDRGTGGERRTCAGLDPKDMEANLTAILDALAAKRVPVLLTGMYAPPNLGPDYQKAFRAVFDRLGRRPGVLYDPFFLEGVALDPSLIQADHLHPNAAGVKREVARILPLVEQLLTEIHPA